MEEDVSKDLAEFALANAIYTALVEGHAAEISARRTAMENASNVSASVSLLEPHWSGAHVNTTTITQSPIPTSPGPL
jgi:hypothetical protein